MNQQTNITISKLLFDLASSNIALGLANCIVFYTFWVDGWSYPSLFIVINLAVIICFYLFRQGLYNPSFSLVQHFKHFLKLFLPLVTITTVYWLLVLDKKYYLVHLILFFTLFLILGLLFRKIWTVVFRKALTGLYSPKNVLLVTERNSNLSQFIKSEKWLNYNLRHSTNNLQEEDLNLYTGQYHIDIVIYDSKLSNWAIENVHSQLSKRYIQLLILNPTKKSNYRLKKIISSYKLFELVR